MRFLWRVYIHSQNNILCINHLNWSGDTCLLPCLGQQYVQANRNARITSLLITAMPLKVYYTNMSLASVLKEGQGIARSHLVLLVTGSLINHIPNCNCNGHNINVC